MANPIPSRNPARIVRAPRRLDEEPRPLSRNPVQMNMIAPRPATPRPPCVTRRAVSVVTASMARTLDAVGAFRTLPGVVRSPARIAAEHAHQAVELRGVVRNVDLGP